MGYKQMDNNISFTDLSLFNSMEHNRLIKRMDRINAIINWSRIESLLLKHYTIGKSAEGAVNRHLLALSRNPSHSSSDIVYTVSTPQK